MRIERATCVNVGGNLPVPLGNAGHSWRERRGMVLRLFDDAGNVGQGEASPLPGYSPEELPSARAALAREPWRRAATIDTAAPVLPQVRHAVEGIDPELPSARFALETAMLDLIGQRMGRPLWVLLTDGEPAGPVPVTCGVGMHDARHAVDDARRAVESGAAAIKVKVGADWQAELGLLRALREELGDAVPIRVDANQSFDADVLIGRLLELAALRIELVEEPCPVQLLETLDRTPVPIALDESLQGPEGPARLSRLGRGLVRYVILKPTTLGGLSACLDIARHARAAGADPIVTHTFDGPIALAAACALAVVLPPPRQPAGLSRHAGLAAYPSVELPMAEPRQIVPSEEPGLGIAPLPVR